MSKDTSTYTATVAARAESHVEAANQEGNIWTPVGHMNVIKMQYKIAIGKIEAGTPEEPNLADTDSHLRGVSLSEIKWGYYGTGEQGNNTAYLEFSIHDIAGQTFEQFLKIKSAAYLVYYHGPDSAGDPWPKNWAMFTPIGDKCDIQFSPTQGFTYSFVCAPYGKLVQSQSLAFSKLVTVNGLGAEGQTVRHGNTFWDYLKEIEHKWKQDLPDSKKTLAEIKFFIRRGDDTGDSLANMPPTMVDPKDAKPQNISGAGGGHLAPFEIKAGTTIATAITNLFQERFAVIEQTAGQGVGEAPVLEINYMKYEAGSQIDVALGKKKTTDVAIDPIPVCIGTDMNCIGAAYRANLVKLEFGPNLLLALSAAVMAVSNGGSTAENSVTQSVDYFEVEHSYKNSCPGNQARETSGLIPYSAGGPVSVNPKFDNWGIIQGYLNVNKHPELTLTIEMPYAFGFSPKYHGGRLKDAVPECGLGAVSHTAGVELKFFWYTSPDCEVLALVPAISTCYRITKVTHTIGLNGNSTQIDLSHVTTGN